MHEVLLSEACPGKKVNLGNLPFDFTIAFGWDLKHRSKPKIEGDVPQVKTYSQIVFMLHIQFMEIKIKLTRFTLYKHTPVPGFELRY